MIETRFYPAIPDNGMTDGVMLMVSVPAYNEDGTPTLDERGRPTFKRLKVLLGQLRQDSRQRIEAVNLRVDTFEEFMAAALQAMDEHVETAQSAIATLTGMSGAASEAAEAARTLAQAASTAAQEAAGASHAASEASAIASDASRAAVSSAHHAQETADAAAGVASGASSKADAAAGAASGAASAADGASKTATAAAKAATTAGEKADAAKTAADAATTEAGKATKAAADAKTAADAATKAVGDLTTRIKTIEDKAIGSETPTTLKSAIRKSGSITISAGLKVVQTDKATMSMTGVKVGDNVNANATSAVPAGIMLGAAYCLADGVVTVPYVIPLAITITATTISMDVVAFRAAPPAV